ncbi:TPA: hypothetical protein ACH3X3_000033 [Trebouxia sp. C0006]
MGMPAADNRAGDSGVERWGRHGHACTSQQGSLMPGQGVALMASSPSIPGLSSCHAVLNTYSHSVVAGGQLPAEHFQPFSPSPRLADAQSTADSVFLYRERKARMSGTREDAHGSDKKQNLHQGTRSSHSRLGWRQPDQRLGSSLHQAACGESSHT